MPLTNAEKNLLATRVYSDFDTAFRERQRLKNRCSSLTVFQVTPKGGEPEYVVTTSEGKAYENLGRRMAKSVKKIHLGQMKNFRRLDADIAKLQDIVRRKEGYLQKYHDKRHELDEDTLEILSVLEQDIKVYCGKIQYLINKRREAAKTVKEYWPTEIDPENIHEELYIRHKPSPPPIVKQAESSST